MDVKEARGILFVEMVKLKMQRKSYYNFEEYMNKDFNLDFEAFINDEKNDVTKTPIERLDFTTRVINCLKVENITTMERLEYLYKDRTYSTCSVLERIPNLGKHSMDEIKNALNAWNNGAKGEYYCWKP